MADTTIKPILSVCATTSSRLPDLAIKNGQLIFIQDKCRIAFDFGDSRKFYNQINELATEYDRTSLKNPVAGSYYFVIETAVLWTYQNRWIQITTTPEEIVFIGAEIPTLGSANKLYVNKKKKEISIWDSENNKYITVADATKTISESDIDLLFV
jgi:hypothetical protein